MVNAILQEELNVIHAFTQKTLTPEQWASKNTKNWFIQNIQIYLSVEHTYMT